MPPVPQGGRRAPITPAPGRERPPVSYTYGGRTGASPSTGTPEQQQQFGWGQSPTLYGAQDLVRPFSPQFQPNAGIFSPSFPLVPVEAELARIFDFPVGVNYIYTPRSYEPITFEELRALAYNENLTRMAIETRKDQLEKLDWQIKPRDEKSAPKDAAARIKKLTDMWHRPDGDRPFAAWLRELLEDVLVIDAPTLEVLRNRDGTVRGYDIIDGSTIKVLIDITGRTPEAPAPAYEQVIHGRPWRLFTEDELIYVPRNKRPGHVYGFSPVEQILMFINIALRRQTTQLSWFTEGNVPQGFMGIPELNAQQVAALQQHLDSMLAGNLAERSKFNLVPYGAKYTAIKQPPLKDDFDEWLARVVMFCFSLPPDAFIRQRARAAAETARQSALEEGLAPLMGWVKRLVDWEIQLRLGHPDLEFSWQDIKQIDPETQSKVETSFIKLGLKTIDESRDIMGLDPLPNGIGSKPFVVAGNQVIMVQDVEQASAQAVAPPPPPMIHPLAGPQAAGDAGRAPTRPGTTGGGGGPRQTGRGPATQRPGAPRQGDSQRSPAAGPDMPKVMKVQIKYAPKVGDMITVEGDLGTASNAPWTSRVIGVDGTRVRVDYDDGEVWYDFDGENLNDTERKPAGHIHWFFTKALKHARAIETRPWPRPGDDEGRRGALEREARHLLRRHRAARVEADLRAVGA